MPSELYCWPPLSGASSVDLPSWDPFCLTVQTLLLFTNTPFVITPTTDPDISPSGTLPVLRDDLQVVGGVHRIIDYLRRNGFTKLLEGEPGAPDALSSKDPKWADMIGCISMVEDKLYDIMQYIHHVSPTFSSSAHQIYASQISFLRSLSFYKSAKNNAIARLNKRSDWSWVTGKKTKPVVRATESPMKAPSLSASTSFGKIEAAPGMVVIGSDPEVCRWTDEDVFAVARQTYKTLSSLLSDNSYYFGSEPTVLDAFVFGHLALHYYPVLSAANSAPDVTDSTRSVPSSPDSRAATPTPTSPDTLRSILEAEFPSLVSYLERIHSQYFTKSNQSFVIATSSLSILPSSPNSLSRSFPTISPAAIIDSLRNFQLPSIDSVRSSITSLPTSIRTYYANLRSFRYSGEQPNGWKARVQRIWRQDVTQSIMTVLTGVGVLIVYINIVKRAEMRKVQGLLEEIQQGEAGDGRGGERDRGVSARDANNDMVDVSGDMDWDDDE
ncbi:hypothetical protein BKA69DRAFT_1097271 [Paraphysoderma sedebokerense]|nr:hypothetical protein BKA69DRAFT_1097271 [Paraphysoderma sedebokerense]